jgi:hypothetical protein
MCELLRRGYIAALAPVGVPNADIIVTDLNGGRLCSVQVKTRRDIGSDKGWHMKSKHETLTEDRLFYCFLDFGKSPLDRPEIFVVPSKIVAKALRDSHASWLSTPGARGQQRKDGEMRRFLHSYERIFGSHENPYPLGWLEEYRDAWHTLGLERVVQKVDEISD